MKFKTEFQFFLNDQYIDDTDELYDLVFIKSKSYQFKQKIRNVYIPEKDLSLTIKECHYYI